MAGYKLLFGAEEELRKARVRRITRHSKISTYERGGGVFKNFRACRV